nr:hypothetical protein [Baekduia alba]
MAVAGDHDPRLGRWPRTRRRWPRGPTSAFNVDNALGAWLGGLTISAGLGYRAPICAGAAMTATGLIVLAVAERAAAEAATAVGAP